LYLERKGECGSPLEDWLKAEKEVEKVNAARIEKSTLLKALQKRSREVPGYAGKAAAKVGSFRR
jgi:hypothetical protein